MSAALPEPQQLAEAGNAASVLQEIVPAQLLRRRAALDVHAKTHAEESLQLLRQLLRLLQPGRAVRGDQVEGLQGLFVEVGGLGLDHLDGHDAEGPDVDLGAVLLLLDDLGRHPVGRTDHGGALGALLGELGAEAEVCDLDVAAGGEEDVVGLDVSVDDVLGVQVHETLACLEIVLAWASVSIGGFGAYLVADGRDLILGDRSIVVDHVRQRTTLHEFHHHPQLEGVFL